MDTTMVAPHLPSLHIKNVHAGVCCPSNDLAPVIGPAKAPDAEARVTFGIGLATNGVKMQCFMDVRHIGLALHTAVLHADLRKIPAGKGHAACRRQTIT